MGLEEEFSKFTHEVGGKFHDVKEHVIMSVERHSFLIAFVLMSVTSAILLVGTIYVWCCHHPGHRHDGAEKTEEKEKTPNGKTKKDKEVTENEEMEKTGIKENFGVGEVLAVPENQGMHESVPVQEEASVVETSRKHESRLIQPKPIPREPPSPTTADGNTSRRRIPSSSGSSINNNESPVKSKIPVRAAKVKST